MLLYDISAVRPEQSQHRVLTDCGSLCPIPSPALQPCSLSKNKQTTHCKLDLAATHDVVQERMHLVDLHGRRGSCIRTVWSEYLHIKGLSMGFADLGGEQRRACGKRGVSWLSLMRREKENRWACEGCNHTSFFSLFLGLHMILISLCLWGETGTVFSWVTTGLKYMKSHT